MTVKAPQETRNRILNAAFEEFYRQGYQGGTLNHIIEQACVTKGALFHHFKGKKELGYAVVDEICAGEVQRSWVDPLTDSSDPVSDLKEIIGSGMREKLSENSEALCQGCPLNNFAQEMSPLDEGFRTRIEAVYKAWRSAIEKAFMAGLKGGTVRKGVSARKTAAFIVAALAGIIGTGKNAQSVELVMDAGEALMEYLDGLRAA